MGFLRFNDSLNLNKGVVSIWYRIPAASAAIAVSRYHSTEEYFGMMGIIPLLTFGPQQEDIKHNLVGPYNIDYDGCRGDFGFCSGSAFHSPFGFSIGGTRTVFRSPSYFGIKFWEDSRTPTFAMNIQTDQYGVQSPDEYSILTGYEYTCDSSCMDGRDPFVYSDTSFMNAERHGAFEGDSGFSISGATDKWHHLLISWDVGGEESYTEDTGLVTTDAVLYITHDKVPKTANALRGSSSFPNMDATLNAGSRGTFTQSIGTIPTNPLCIPGPAIVKEEYGAETEPVLTIEMAELQIFSGVNVDTSDADIIKMFVTSSGKPAAANLATEGLGQPPDIQLIGRSSNWIAGTNSGVAGNLDPIGTITEYATGPELTP